MHANRHNRIVITRLGLDAHDRGARIVASYLRSAGMEVIYTPPWQTVSDVIALVVQEDAAAIGVSSLAGDHKLVSQLCEALSEAGLSTIPVIVGGIVPESDKKALLQSGVSCILGPGTSRQEIIDAFNRACAQPEN